MLLQWRSITERMLQGVRYGRINQTSDNVNLGHMPDSSLSPIKTFVGDENDAMMTRIGGLVIRNLT